MREISAYARELVERTCAEQGVPVIPDAAVLEMAAAIFALALNEHKKAS